MTLLLEEIIQVEHVKDCPHLLVFVRCQNRIVLQSVETKKHYSRVKNARSLLLGITNLAVNLKKNNAAVDVFTD